MQISLKWQIDKVFPLRTANKLIHKFCVTYQFYHKLSLLIRMFMDWKFVPQLEWYHFTMLWYTKFSVKSEFAKRFLECKFKKFLENNKFNKVPTRLPLYLLGYRLNGLIIYLMDTLEFTPTSWSRSHAKVPTVEMTARLTWRVRSASLVSGQSVGTSSLLLQPLNIKHGIVNRAFNCQTTKMCP